MTDNVIVKYFSSQLSNTALMERDHFFFHWVLVYTSSSDGTIQQLYYPFSQSLVNMVSVQVICFLQG